MMRAHKLKTWPEQFAALEREEKTCELRFADRDYRVGDYLMLMEFKPSADTLTGKYIFRKITHILTGDVVPRALICGHVVLSVAPCDGMEEAILLGNHTLYQKAEWIDPPKETASA